jgi:peptidyl-prolyl cis-trans isomerase D
VKDDVKKDWSLDEQRTRLAKFTDELVKQLNSGKTLDDLAKEQNTQVVATEPLKRNGLTVNVLPVAVKQAFALPQGGSGSAPSGVEEGRIVFQVDKVEAPAPLEGPALDALRRQLRIFVGEDIIGEYFSALEARYGVTINRQALTKLAGGSEEQ